MKQKITKRLPTIEEWEWLIDNCKWEWDDSLKGQKVTAINGNSIFLPAAGNRCGTNLNGVGSFGYYWSSSLNKDCPGYAYCVYFYSGDVIWDFIWDYDDRYAGFSVRLVSDNPQEGFVDMGNGICWAKENEHGLFTYDEAMKLYVKEKQDDAESYIITGWIARDSVEDNHIGTGLCIHYKKPTRCGREWNSYGIAMHLPFGAFPALQWEDEPIEVEIKIKRK